MRVVKGQAAPSVTALHSVNKNALPLASDWNHSLQSTAQHPVASSNIIERPVAEAADEIFPFEDEG